MLGGHRSHTQAGYLFSARYWTNMASSSRNLWNIFLNLVRTGQRQIVVFVAELWFYLIFIQQWNIFIIFFWKLLQWNKFSVICTKNICKWSGACDAALLGYSDILNGRGKFSIPKLAISMGHTTIRFWSQNLETNKCYW